MSKKELFAIEIRLIRYFDGTEEEAIAEAEDDWDYFQNECENGRWNNKPIGEASVTPINEWSKHIGDSHYLNKKVVER